MVKLNSLKAGLYAAAICGITLLQSCGDSFDVIPTDGVTTHQYKLYDSTVLDYYFPTGENVAKDTVIHYSINSVFSFKFDSVHDYIMLENGDTLRRISNDTLGYWGNGQGAFDRSTQLIFSKDSVKINREGLGVQQLTKTQRLSGHSKL